MQGAVAVVDAVVFTKAVETETADAADFLAREIQRVEQAEAVFQFIFQPGEFEFAVKERLVERHIVGDKLVRAFKIFQQFRQDSGKSWLVRDALIGNAMYADGICLNGLLRVEIAVEITLGRAAVDEFNAADFNNAMAFRFVATIEIHARRFRIEDDLTHGVSLLQRAGTFDAFGNGAEKFQIFWRFLGKDFCTGAHISAHQFISGAVFIAQFKLGLAEAQMNEGIADSVRAAHCVLQSGQGGSVIAVQKVGVADGNENPRCRCPVFFGIGEEVPGVLVRSDSIAVFAFFGEGIADFAEAVDAGVQVRVEFGHGVP